jgi:hypothetical protein
MSVESGDSAQQFSKSAQPLNADLSQQRLRAFIGVAARLGRNLQPASPVS